MLSSIAVSDGGMEKGRGCDEVDVANIGRIQKLSMQKENAQGNKETQHFLV